MTKLLNDEQRQQQGTGGEQQSAIELRLELALEEERGETDANLAEGRALALAPAR